MNSFWGNKNYIYIHIYIHTYIWNGYCVSTRSWHPDLEKISDYLLQVPVYQQKQNCKASLINWSNLKKTMHKMLQKTHTFNLLSKNQHPTKLRSQIQFLRKAVILLCPPCLNCLPGKSVIALNVTGRDCCQVMNCDGMLRSQDLCIMRINGN